MTVTALTVATLTGALAVSRYFATANIVWLTAASIQLRYLQPVARVAANENRRRAA